MRKTIDKNRLKSIGHDLLLAIGEDPTEPRIKGTPKRFADWWAEFIEYDPGNVETAFESTTSDQMVVVSGIRVWSLCEHHLLPFWCSVSIGYIPNGKVLGLSKFGRIAHHAAHRLQIQERLIQDISKEVERVTGSKDIAVIGRGEHLCMSMRGIKTEALMTSSVMLGAFRKEEAARAEFLQLILKR